MQNLFAHTDAGHDYPAYLSINKDDDGRLRVSVRSAGNGGRDLGEVHVSPETLEHMATEVIAKLNGEAPIVTVNDIIRFTNGEDGVFAHVLAPNGNHFGVSIDTLADGAGLQSRFFGAVADLVRAGALPTGPVLHTPSGVVFDEVIAAAEPADLVALTPQEHQCCGKCEKSAADQVADDFAATMEKSSRPGDEPTHYSGLGDVECCETVPPLSREPQEADTDWRERYLRDVEGLNNEGDPIGGEPAMGLRQVAEHQRAVIQDLAYRLQTADYVILALLIKAGGEVVVTSEDCGKVPGNVVTNEVSEDKSTFTFRAVAVPPQVAQ